MKRVPLVLLAAQTAAVCALGAGVVLEGGDGNFKLLRDGKPYFVEGVGGGGPKDLLAAIGGNSFRTWGSGSAKADLDEAQKHGLTATIGFWFGHQQHGFDYSDPQALEKQKANVLEVVSKMKDHSALLIWALGENGGEKVSFQMGGLDKAKFSDTGKADLKDVVLKPEWTRYRMPLDGRDMSRIKTGFGWSLAHPGNPITFYLDDIEYTAD